MSLGNGRVSALGWIFNISCLPLRETWRLWKSIHRMLQYGLTRDALSTRAYKDYYGASSNGRCIRECAHRGFTFAGTTATNECHCGNNYDYHRYGERKSSCSNVCKNNIAETCGGDWNIQIYSVCPTGKYKGTGDAFINNTLNCENECHCKSLPCLNFNGRCKDGCATGWSGRSCNRIGEDCSVNNGGCQHHCNEYAADEWCSCHNGYKVSTTDWKNCIDINECNGEKGEDNYEDCQICVNTIGSYTCNCRDGYALDSSTNQTCIDIMECDGTRGVEYDQNCHTCVNTNGSYTCECRDGYELDPSTNQTCNDVVECDGRKGMDYAQNCHACLNTIGSYTCDCDHGYELNPSTNQTCIGSVPDREFLGTESVRMNQQQDARLNWAGSEHERGLESLLLSCPLSLTQNGICSCLDRPDHPVAR
ncbi:hypothetical protein CAPTEDRAFT_209067 [Capitella teleta]|uniref:WSC domain-containing protein n=1 Tax=Capitella teleta TaxID=283909 RepID=R7VBS3_CAPTE|nr:hypothetical protein CAPTEDRAFT_209067 [Capitella teleta]|eukprot:ELU16278.1 hypothetical protein CAPTEDRAFT_209067 [Capitella teleta]